MSFLERNFLNYEETKQLLYVWNLNSLDKMYEELILFRFVTVGPIVKNIRIDGWKALLTAPAWFILHNL